MILTALGQCSDRSVWFFFPGYLICYFRNPPKAYEEKHFKNKGECLLWESLGNVSLNEYFLTLGYYKFVFSSACRLYKLQTSFFLGRFWGLVVGWGLFEVSVSLNNFFKKYGVSF